MGKNGFKMNDRYLTADYLASRAHGLAAAGYSKPKWIRFCEVLLAEGYEVWGYEARQTVSKYITVGYPGNRCRFKVRFSNHKPIKERELQGDCDFFVGITNLRTTHSRQALDAVRAYFNRPASVTFTEKMVEDTMFEAC